MIACIYRLEYRTRWVHMQYQWEHTHLGKVFLWVLVDIHILPYTAIMCWFWKTCQVISGPAFVAMQNIESNGISIFVAVIICFICTRWVQWLLHSGAACWLYMRSWLNIPQLLHAIPMVYACKRGIQWAKQDGILSFNWRRVIWRENEQASVIELISQYLGWQNEVN